MKIKHVTQVLAGVLSFGMFVPASVRADIVQQKGVGTAQLERFATQYNHALQNWSSLQKNSAKMHRNMGLRFNPAYDTQDKKYFTQLTSEIPEMAPARVAGDHIEFLKPGTDQVILTAKPVAEDKFEFNGKSFEYDSSQPLEANMGRIKVLLKGDKTASSFIDGIFMPRAEAGDDGDGGAASSSGFDWKLMGLILLGGVAAFCAWKWYQNNNKVHALRFRNAVLRGVTTVDGVPVPAVPGSLPAQPPSH